MRAPGVVHKGRAAGNFPFAFKIGPCDPFEAVVADAVTTGVEKYDGIQGAIRLVILVCTHSALHHWRWYVTDPSSLGLELQCQCYCGCMIEVRWRMKVEGVSQMAAERAGGKFQRLQCVSTCRPCLLLLSLAFGSIVILRGKRPGELVVVIGGSMRVCTDRRRRHGHSAGGQGSLLCTKLVHNLDTTNHHLIDKTVRIFPVNLKGHTHIIKRETKLADTLVQSAGCIVGATWLALAGGGGSSATAAVRRF